MEKKSLRPQAMTDVFTGAGGGIGGILTSKIGNALNRDCSQLRMRRTSNSK